MGRFNEENELKGRAFFVHRANEWYLESEARVALTLAEVVGSQEALDYIDVVEKRTAEHFPEYFDEEDPHHRYLARLNDLKDFIAKYGESHDRKLAEQGQASVVDPNEP